VIFKNTLEKVTLKEYSRRSHKDYSNLGEKFYGMDLLGMTEYEDVTWEPGTFVNSYRRTQKAKSYDY
jgi:hypothetical protein